MNLSWANMMHTSQSHSGLLIVGNHHDVVKRNVENVLGAIVSFYEVPGYDNDFKRLSQVLFPLLNIS